MKNKNVIRYGCFILLGIVMNLLFYNVAHWLHLPAWLDNLGTAYVAFALEPAAGLLVAFATNFYEATVIYDSSSLIYYAASACVALSIGLSMRKNGRINFKGIFKAFVLMFVTTTVVASLVTLWRTGGVSDSTWEQHFYQIAFDATQSNILSCFFATGVLKLVDTAAVCVMLVIMYFIVPKKWINIENKTIVSFKNPYFKHKAKDKNK